MPDSSTGAFGSCQTYAPRPRVQTDSVVAPRSIWRSQIIVCGRPLSKRNHVGDTALMSFVK